MDVGSDVNHLKAIGVQNCSTYPAHSRAIARQPQVRACSIPLAQTDMPEVHCPVYWQSYKHIAHSGPQSLLTRDDLGLGP